MKSPREIAALAVQEEIYARAVFERLIHLHPSAFLPALQHDPAACTEAMARLILDYVDESYITMPPEHALELVGAAELAAANAEPHIQLRVAKDLANTYRYLNRFADAEAALKRAESLVSQTIATELHRAVVDFAKLALYHDIERAVSWSDLVEDVIRRFEESGAADRAYTVRLYDACVSHWMGRHLAALVAYEDAIRRAQTHGSQTDVARAFFNVAIILRALGDLSRARACFAKAALLQRACGSAADEAVALRCVARLSIRMHGTSRICEMDAVKNRFLELDLAGEVCRCTIAIMEELIRRDPTSNLAGLGRELDEEMLTLGVTPMTSAINSLHESVHANCVTDEVLREAWDAFGPSQAFTTISAITTQRN
jgi:tetratricopeptide (TPR) repeat protein